MIIQINSGNGPKECERACYLYYQELLKQYPDLEIIHEKYSDKECALSVDLYTEKDLSHLSGTVQWICISPFRPHHKRKNWFINVCILEEKDDFYNTKEIRYETMHSSGKGGQNVNKVSTAVRAIHIPTQLSATCMDQRSQIQNKKIATIRLLKKLEMMHEDSKNKIQYQNWNQHNQIVRGNPHSVYKGKEFKRI